LLESEVGTKKQREDRKKKITDLTRQKVVIQDKYMSTPALANLNRKILVLSDAISRKKKEMDVTAARLAQVQQIKDKVRSFATK
jgi:hypothetical protein